MKHKKIPQAILLVLSTAFLLVIVSTFIADRLYSMTFSVESGKRECDNAIGLMNKAIILDPGNAALYFRKYELLKMRRKEGGHVRRPSKEELQLLKKCIELRPFWPKYHLLYGLTLKRMHPKPNIMTKQMINSEIKKATDLKPFSKMYSKIYIYYLNKYSPKTP